MKNLIQIVFVALILGGCAGSPSGPPAERLLRDGTYGWTTVCNGGIGYCHKKAREFCKNGFDVIDEYREGQAGSMNVPGGSANMFNRMVLDFKCK